MTAAETLRTAAKAMRERAEAASPSPWVQTVWPKEIPGVYSQGIEDAREFDPEIARTLDKPDAEHIASWHPAVALAVAKAMDDVAQAWEIADEANDGYVYDADDNHYRFEETVDGGWLAVANAYLNTAQEPT